MYYNEWEDSSSQQILSYMLVGVMGVAVLFYYMFIIWLTMLAVKKNFVAGIVWGEGYGSIKS